MSHILECEDLLVCLKHHKTNVFARNSKSSFLICSLSKVTGPIGIITVRRQLLILAPSTTIWIKAGGVLVNNPAIKDKIETTNFNLQFVRTVTHSVYWPKTQSSHAFVPTATVLLLYLNKCCLRRNYLVSITSKPLAYLEEGPQGPAHLILGKRIVKERKAAGQAKKRPLSLAQGLPESATAILSRIFPVGKP